MYLIKFSQNIHCIVVKLLRFLLNSHKPENTRERTGRRRERERQTSTHTVPGQGSSQVKEPFVMFA